MERPTSLGADARPPERVVFGEEFDALPAPLIPGSEFCAVACYKGGGVTLVFSGAVPPPVAVIAGAITALQRWATTVDLFAEADAEVYNVAAVWNWGARRAAVQVAALPGGVDVIPFDCSADAEGWIADATPFPFYFDVLAEDEPRFGYRPVTDDNLPRVAALFAEAARA